MRNAHTRPHRTIAKILIWLERHAGLASWAGALGGVLAIIAAWSISRSEYMRTQWQEQVRRDAEIQEIRAIILNFDPIVKRYVVAVRKGDTDQKHLYYARHMNDAEESAARDLAFIPVMQWPSLTTYLHFKRYWNLSIQILETSQNDPIDSAKVETMVLDRENELTKARGCALSVAWGAAKSLSA
jgi:hypothetical protein